MAPRFRRAFYKLLPTWLGGGQPSPSATVDEDEGERVQYSLGVTIDAFLERCRQGVLARYPEHCPADALAYHGRDRKIVRGINESADSYAERLLRWLDDHRVRGNPFALLEQLQAYCNVDLMVRTVDTRGNWFTIAADGTRSVLLDQGNWDWDGAAASEWGRFWVIIYPPATGELWNQTPNWGDADLWGGEWGRAGYTWGSTATPDQVQAVRSIVRQWKPAGTTCEWVVLAFAPASFDPTDASPPNPDGDWGIWHERVNPAVPVRLGTASYWDGP